MFLRPKIKFHVPDSDKMKEMDRGGHRWWGRGRWVRKKERAKDKREFRKVPFFPSTGILKK